METDDWREAWQAAELADSQRAWQRSAALWAGLYGRLTDAERKRAGLRAAAAFRKSADFSGAAAILASLVESYPSYGVARRELARLETNIARAEADDAYWEQRRSYIYLLVLKEIASCIASNANSVLDVGSNAMPVLDWFPAVPVRYSVDLRRPYKAARVTSVKADFRSWKSPLKRIDVGLCLQVIEHLQDPAAFLRKLLSLCDVSVVSVPYKWPAGQVKFHRHDEIDEARMREWSGRSANYTYVTKELFGEQRLICVYDRESEDAWRTVSDEAFRYRWSLRGSEKILALAGAQSREGSEN